MITILGIAGSLREKSFNRSLLRAAQASVPADARIELASIGDFPLYNGDVEEQSGIPPAVEKVKNQLASAHGLLLVTPEYNNSIPGVFKNAIDWLSRPPKDTNRVFGHKPVGIIGASPSLGGTRFSQTAWLPIFRALNMRMFTDKAVYLAEAHKMFDAQGELTDDKLRGLVAGYVAGLVEFVKQQIAQSS